jgi:AcrR family transcriptional regulator
MQLSPSKSKVAVAPYHHGDLRRALIETGLRLLEKQGPAQVSLREVARAAGVSHSAPYRHFVSREALLAALATDGFEALGEAMARAADGKEGLERLQALGMAYITFAEARPAVYLLMFSPELVKDPYPALRTLAEQSFDTLRQTIATVTTEEMRGVAAIGAWALVHGLAHLIADQQLSPKLVAPNNMKELIESALAIYSQGLAAEK